MVEKFKTPQEEFWAGEFGTDYIGRNKGNHLLACKASLFGKIFAQVRQISSVMEFGANIGLNLRVIKQLIPKAELSAVEINSVAVKELRKWGEAYIYQGSILDFEPKKTVDFVFTSGVLIHIDPDSLSVVYDRLYETSHRYICVIEYYNPTPVAISYRGHENKLFKRDFAGELLDRFSDLVLVDYGFVYRRDPNFPQDDPTWFVMEKDVRHK